MAAPLNDGSFAAAFIEAGEELLESVFNNASVANEAAGVLNFIQNVVLNALLAAEPAEAPADVIERVLRNASVWVEFTDEFADAVKDALRDTCVSVDAEILQTMDGLLRNASLFINPTEYFKDLALGVLNDVLLAAHPPRALTQIIEEALKNAALIAEAKDEFDEATETVSRCLLRAIEASDTTNTPEDPESASDASLIDSTESASDASLTDSTESALPDASLTDSTGSASDASLIDSTESALTDASLTEDTALHLSTLETEKLFAVNVLSDTILNENPTEKQTKDKKKKGIRGFFRKTWKGLKRPFRNNKKRVDPVDPLTVPADMSAVPGPSGLQQIPSADSSLSETSAVPGPSGLQQISATDLFDFKADSVPDAFELKRRPDIKLVRSKLYSLPVPLEFMSTKGSVTFYYKVGNLIGTGTFGKVFEGIRKSDGQKVAIKFLPKSGFDDYLVIPGYPQPVLKEVALLLMMKRPHISPYIIEMMEWFEDPGKYALVYEYPHPCETLTEFIAREDRLSERTARVLMRQVVLAVRHCHEHGIFHGDVQSDNILVNKNTMEIKLIDFGCACLINRAGNESKNYTGALKYCPPEVLTKKKYQPDPAAVWSLGVLLFEMMNKMVPFHKTSQIWLADVHFRNPDLSNVKKCPNRRRSRSK